MKAFGGSLQAKGRWSLLCIVISIPNIVKHCLHVCPNVTLQTTQRFSNTHLKLHNSCLSKSPFCAGLQKTLRYALARLLAGAAPRPQVLLQLLRDDPRLAPRGQLRGALGEGLQGGDVGGEGTRARLALACRGHVARVTICRSGD